MEQQDGLVGMGSVEGQHTIPPIGKFYTPAQVSKLIGISEQSVRIQFRSVKGVLVIGEGLRKRIRIPELLLRDWIDSRLVEGVN